MTTPNVPNRPCAISPAGDVWGPGAIRDCDTPATAMPNERLARIRTHIEKIAAATDSMPIKTWCAVCLAELGE